VGGEVAQDHDVTPVKGRGQLGFDVKVEEFLVHRPTDQPRRIQPVMAQGGDERLGVPMAERGVMTRRAPPLTRIFLDIRPSGQKGMGLLAAHVRHCRGRLRDPAADHMDPVSVNSCIESLEGFSLAARPEPAI